MVLIKRPVAISHSLMPDEPVARMVWPSGANATETWSTESECPRNVRIRRRVAKSHNFRLLSELADSTNAPLGENATEVMVVEWPTEGTISNSGPPEAPCANALSIARSDQGCDQR